MPVPSVIRTGLALIALAVLAAALVFLSPANRTPTAAQNAFDAEAVEGELLVRFADGVPAFARAALAGVAASETATIEGLGVARLRLRPGVAVEDARALYESTPGVDFAEPNYAITASDIPNDPLFAIQRWYYQLAEAPQAWDIEPGDASIVVAILDSGIDAGHADLTGKLWRNEGETPGDGVDNDGNGCVDDVYGCNFLSPDESSPSCGTPPPRLTGDVTDEAGHGTFVAGIIGASTNNGLGVASFGRNVQVLPVKVLDCAGAGSTADAAEGLLYALRAGAQVVNLSFGGDSDSLTFQIAVRRAYEDFGAVLVAPSGNKGAQGVTYPARYVGVVAVGASARNSDTDRAPFSNWGPEVDVVAPGVDIVSTVPEALCGVMWTCLAGQPYARASGTSFAAPQVAALAALLLSRSPTMSPTEVAAAIRSSAQPLPDNGTPGWAGSGRLRMARALGEVTFRIGGPGVARN